MADDTAVADKKGKQQMFAGALSVLFSYAALGALMSDPIKTFITDAHWQQAPLHLAFVAVTAAAGMGVMAGIQRFRNRNADESPPDLSL